MNQAAVFLRRLKSLGIDYIFANPGSEFIPLIEAYGQGGEFPKPVTVAHESLAVAMAHGYYLATGKPQAVMVHVNVGTANALGGLIGAHHMNVPLLFLAGRTPVRETGETGARDRFVHWAQESYDQGAQTREFTKWNYEIRHPEMIEGALGRAAEIMMEGVKGPVQLTFSREIFTAEMADAPEPYRAPDPVKPPAASDLGKLPDFLQSSRRGIVITSRTGMDESSVRALETFCARFQLGILTPQAQAVNVRGSFPNYLGFENERAFNEADLIIALDTDVPWLPHRQTAPGNSVVVNIGPDPLFKKIPMRGFRSDLNLTGDVTSVLKSLMSGPAKSPSPWLEELRAGFEQKKSTEQNRARESEKLTFDSLAVMISDQQDADTVILNELSLPAHLMEMEKPGTYFRSGSASSLGWALGCAMGIKEARPESVPVACVGDGVFYLSNPMAAHWQAKKAPFLTVIMNNQCMRSVHEGKVFTDLSPSLDFAAIAVAAGGFGARAENSAEFKHALANGIARVRTGQWGVIDARLGS